MPHNDLFKFISLRPTAVPPSAQDPASPIARRLNAVAARHARVLAQQAAIDPSTEQMRLAAARRRHGELLRLIKQHESLQRAAHKTYLSLVEVAPTAIMERTTATGFEAAVPSTRIAALGTSFYGKLEARLGGAERETLTATLARIPGGAPVNFHDLLDGLSVDAMIEEANEICTEIRATENADGHGLPTAPPSQTSPEKPLVSSVGWGDLVVARESLVGYVAREIAHIENVMSGESKFREHERNSRTEQVEESEVITEKESEKDSQSTDRYELQSEAQETIQNDFAISAGVNTSGRYGLTQVDTSLDASFSQSQTQSRSNSVNTAQEIVSRAVERTFERVRKLRRLTITEELRELNRHELKNVRSPGEDPTALSGIYLWVEKVQQVELRQYGTRLMVEFHVPEPALSILERGLTTGRAKTLPPFDVGPASVNEGNYLCLAQRYGAGDISPPPAQFVRVGFTWESSPDEEANRNGESTISKTIPVTAGYRPVSGTVFASALETSTLNDTPGSYDFSLAVAGVTVVAAKGAKQVDRAFSLVFTTEWPNGVPVSGRVHGHFDTTMAVQVTLLCERTTEAMMTWRLRTWEALKAGYDALARQVSIEAQREDLARALFSPTSEGPEAENRAVERAELQKWSIKALRLKSNDFNAIEQVGDYQEISPLDADLQAPIVRFFEDAFEWEHMSYFLYPYYWARRATWNMRRGATAIDARYKAFLQAGAARVIVPVTPGYEGRVLAFLESDPATDERARITAALPATAPTGSPFSNIWTELLIDRKADVALGSGTLKAQQGSEQVTINADSEWHASAVRDIGREVYLDGDRYLIARVIDAATFELDALYRGVTNRTAVYVAGSVPFGPPWTVNVPTTLIVLSDNRDALKQLV